MELIGIVEATNTGKFNYHLKVLADLIQKDDKGRYGLTNKGQLAAQILTTFKEKKIESTPLRMADALLIGFVGFILTLANPGFWVFMLAAASGVESISFLSFLGFLTTVFAIILPGPLMWLLTVRRSHSHDSYDLYKAPFLAFIMMLILLLVMLLLQINIGSQVAIQIGETTSSGTVPIPGGGSSSSSSSAYTIMSMSLSSVLALGMICSFVGVAIAEFAFRLKKKAAFRR
jgi:hypothetical protein